MAQRRFWLYSIFTLINTWSQRHPISKFKRGAFLKAVFSFFNLKNAPNIKTLRHLISYKMQLSLLYISYTIDDDI